MARDLPDRRDRLFGREGDVAHLLQRARFKGLTAVVARPQMGKSWLLTELARRLSSEHEPRHLVGFAESFGETPDLLLRTVVDLYARWLSDAGSWQRAKRVWENEKVNLLPSFAKTMAKILAEVADPVTKPVAPIVEEAIAGLLAADERLKTGGLQLPRLSYEQARDLVSSVAKISGRPIALFLDQWEKSPDTFRESKTLDSFLHHLDEWPSCHIFMALRSDDAAQGEVEKLADSLPGTADTYRLGEMNLGAEESLRLTDHVRATVPAAQNESDEDLLRLVDGYPGVLYQWTRDYQRTHMRTVRDLQRVADDAQEYRFSDLKVLLPKLDGDQRRLAIRLALLPVSGAELLVPLEAEIRANLAPDTIDDLRLGAVLEQSDPPGLGHSKRWEAARAWFVENRRAATRIEAEALILRLATPLREVEPRFAPNLLALWSLRSQCGELGLSAAATALCELVGLALQAQIRPEVLISGAVQARAPEFAAIAPFLAIGLFDAMIDAKAEHDLTRRDALLEELRELAKAHPDNVADKLAMALFNTLNDAKAENDLPWRDALLEELRSLARALPEDAVVRHMLAKGLNNSMAHAAAEDDLARREDLLQELRQLADAHPEDAVVSEQLAGGLLKSILVAFYHGRAQQISALQEELRALTKAHPELTG